MKEQYPRICQVRNQAMNSIDQLAMAAASRISGYVMTDSVYDRVDVVVQQVIEDRLRTRHSSTYLPPRKTKL